MSFNKCLPYITIMVNVSIIEEESKENNQYFKYITWIQINIDISPNHKNSHKESLTQFKRRCMYIKNVNKQIQYFIVLIWKFIVFFSLRPLIACDSHFYGENCSMPCGNCLESEQCQHINGTCMNGCASGYQGPTCKEGKFVMFLLYNQ